MEESTCKLYQKCITYLPDETHPHGHHKDSWVCQLSDEDSARMGVDYVDLVESPSLARKIESATSGDSMLTVSEAFVDPDSPRMYIPEDAILRVESESELEIRTQKKHRKLASKKPARTGTLKALVVRLTVNGKQPTISVSKLVNDVFQDSVSLSTQTQKCSYGKLKIEPFVGRTPSNKQINNGVVDVSMSYDGGPIDHYARKAANAQLGNLDDPRFDLVLFAVPSGIEDFLAFASPETKYSFYNDVWAGSVLAQMHEVGHNIGLGHSGQLNEGEYGDITGMMGNPGGGEDAQICYNAQKNFQLGWYADKTKSINPLDGSNNGVHEFIFNGVSDYKRNNNALISLRLIQEKLQGQYKKQQDVYIGFNAATGIHSGTNEDPNKLTITRKDYGKPDAYGQSTKLKTLNVGQTYVLKNFNQERDIHITFLSLSNGDARVRIKDLQPPKPTRAPTMSPTHKAGPCIQHTVEFQSDNYPGDNSWELLLNNHVYFRSPKYTAKNKLYKTQVCLEVDQNYQFKFKDAHGDGLQGDSFYRIVDSCSKKAIVTSDQHKGTEFRETSTALPKIKQCASSGVCKNKYPRKHKFKLQGQRGKRLRSCKNLAKRKKCNKRVTTGEWVWELCKKSCNRCDN